MPRIGNKQRILVIGSGPTGLGAATRLEQLGCEAWQLFEASSHPGGLAASVVDPQGFTWDLGGHVIFSHYKYFDELLNKAMGDDWYTHQRESWVWIENRWVPYPFQNNIHRLTLESTQRCLEGLIRAAERRHTHSAPQNFQEWIDQRLGSGIAALFMNPYNFKVWGIQPSGMSAGWLGERVAQVDIARVTNNVVNKKDDLSWGPNAVFRFPGHGGTGAIWKRVCEMLPQTKVSTNVALESLNVEKKEAKFSDGRIETYDALISTIPLDVLLGLIEGHDEWKALGKQLVHSSTHIVGIGLEGETPAHLNMKCWLYFPESNCPFYRVTIFSHYSPNHVPKDGKPYWSLMMEVCESESKPLSAEEKTDMVAACIEGLLNTKLISAQDKIVSKWHTRLEYGYPTPFLGRDALLAQLQPSLESVSIYSRGRFGGWRYEIGNQDHCLMQGVEVADRIVFGVEEETYSHPDLVNGRKVTQRSYGDGSRLFT